jgi:hypothetical protein
MVRPSPNWHGLILAEDGEITIKAPSSAAVSAAGSSTVPVLREYMVGRDMHALGLLNQVDTPLSYL